ncbi:hypothetical protein ACIBK8_13710 [Streptomyces sp. NPDC050161]|uniref:hypothetical protein n=1 Tax=Streptomyces sp. NPDC050161 TaxID=3365604 RepID=UPI0037AF505B
MDISAAHLRAVRAALFTALCVTLSAASHVLLSRMPLPLTTVAVLSAAVFALAYALAGQERSYGRIAALLVPLELAADASFSIGQHTCYGSGPVTGPLRSLGVNLLCGGGDVGTPLAQLPEHGPRDASAAAWLLLLGAHLLIGLLAAAWLRRGEAALAQLLGAVAGFAFRPLLIAAAMVARVSATDRPAAPRAADGPPARAVPLLVHCVVRRGPPCVLAA